MREAIFGGVRSTRIGQLLHECLSNADTYFAYLLAILVWLSMQYIYVFPLHTSPLTYSRAWGNPLKEESSFSSSFSSRSLHKFTVTPESVQPPPFGTHSL